MMGVSYNYSTTKQSDCLIQAGVSGGAGKPAGRKVGLLRRRIPRGAGFYLTQQEAPFAAAGHDIEAIRRRPVFFKTT